MGCTSVLVNSTNLLASLIFPPIDSAAAPNRSLGSGLQQNVIAGMKDTGSDDERFESGPAAAAPFPCITAIAAPSGLENGHCFPIISGRPTSMSTFHARLSPRYWKAWAIAFIYRTQGSKAA